MLKRLCCAALAALSFQLAACWFDEENFDGNFIAGVNNFQAHHSAGAASLASATYSNGAGVAMPITVWVKVSPRAGNRIVRATLQYKVLPNGNWVTVRTIDNPSWDMDFSHPVALFGRNCIDIPGVAAGTAILIRLYLSDGTYETGSLSADITETVPDTATAASGGVYSGGWTAPFIMRVICTGTRRAR